ncbi:MAG TPA: biotin transporter BioY [Ignavibacteriaceae bacterium]|nr:biotin transporter BioY [Ignavibacteriaceae bacterium]
MSYKENISKSKFLNLVSILNTSQAFWILSFSLLTAIASQITIPVRPVPFTFQTMVVVMSGAFLGAKKGFYSQIVYLFAGCLGMPVFAQIPDATIGFARLFGPTGGYLLAFPLAALLTGYLAKFNKSYIWILISMFLGNSLILLAGSIYLGTFYLKNMLQAFEVGLIPFLIWEMVKVFIGANIYFGISKKQSGSSK